MADREELAYLRRYRDAVGTLAEMTMTAPVRRGGTRYVAFYDDDADEWVVACLLRRADDGSPLVEEVVRSDEFPTAVEHAYDIHRAGAL